jgi:hypothetical protein
MWDVPASLLPSSHVCDSQDCGISGLPELGTVKRHIAKILNYIYFYSW